MHIKPTKFYTKIGTKNMASLMTEERDKDYIDFIRKHISKEQKILDVACGYGRMTIPLAKLGYDIEGVDLTPNFIKDAIKFAKEKHLKIKFKVGDMRDLHYRNNSFDAVICLWSSFNHILTQRYQIKTLKEMYRIAKNNGLIIIDMPYHKEPTKKQIEQKLWIGRNCRLYKTKIYGLDNIDYIHNKRTLLNIMNRSRIKNYNIRLEDIGGRKRLILYIHKV